MVRMVEDFEGEMEMVNPPEGFAIVEPGVYRSNIPYPGHFPFLKKLDLNTVVVLSPERPVRAVTDFLEEAKINMVHLGQRAWAVTGWKPLNEEIIKEGLELVLDRLKHPIMVMCTFRIVLAPSRGKCETNNLRMIYITANTLIENVELQIRFDPYGWLGSFGIHQTGILVGCLRRLQRWNLNSILYEYNMYAREKGRYMNVQFIEIFDLDLVTLPSNLPQWFLNQQKMLEDEQDGLIPAYLTEPLSENNREDGSDDD